MRRMRAILDLEEKRGIGTIDVSTVGVGITSTTSMDENDTHTTAFGAKRKKNKNKNKKTLNVEEEGDNSSDVCLSESSFKRTAGGRGGGGGDVPSKSSSGPLLRVDNVRCSWTSHQAPMPHGKDGVTFSVAPKKMVVITGGVGVGKSTMLKAIAGETLVRDGSFRGCAMC
jgi:ABC-type glutathione transport system ATPase component